MLRTIFYAALWAKVYPAHGPFLLGTVENLLSNQGNEDVSRLLRVDPAAIHRSAPTRGGSSRHNTLE